LFSIILGREEAEVYRTLLTWPVHHHLEYVLEKENQSLEPIWQQILKIAIHHSRIKREWTQLQQTVALNSVSARECTFRKLLK